MKKKDIDLYLEKMNSAISEADKLEVSKIFFKEISDAFAPIYEDRRIGTAVCTDIELQNYLVESGALVLCHSICARVVPDVPRVCKKIAETSEARNLQEVRSKRSDINRELIADFDLRFKSLSPEELEVYDGLLTLLIDNALKHPAKNNEWLERLVQRFFYAVSDPIKQRATALYNQCLRYNIVTNSSVIKMIPFLPKEGYEKLLDSFEFDSKGVTTNYEMFDNIAYEYLCLYSEEIEVEKKYELFKKVYQNFPPGGLVNSMVYGFYFSFSNKKEDQALLVAHRVDLLKDIFARIYENQGQYNLITNFEKDFLEDLFLPRIWDDKEKKVFLTFSECEEVKCDTIRTGYSLADCLSSDLEPEKKESSIRALFAKKLNLPGDFQVLPGETEEFLGELFCNAHHDSVELARYVIRLSQLPRPRDPNLGRIHDYVSRLNIVDKLTQNFEPSKLREYDPNEPMPDWRNIFDTMGIAYTEEDIRQREASYRKRQEMHQTDDLNIRNGLRRIDYMDIALELIVEATANNPYLNERNSLFFAIRNTEDICRCRKINI